MKKQLLINESEDLFSFTKKIKKDSIITKNKKILIITTSVLLIFSVFNNIPKTNLIKNSSYNTIQSHHELKTKSTQLISNINFNYDNYKSKFNELESNPLMTYQGYNSIIKNLIENDNIKKNHSFYYQPLEKEYPSVQNASYIDGKQNISIIYPINKVSIDLKSTNKIVEQGSILLTYELINQKYQIINFIEK